MADDQRVYSDEEFALILQQAAEIASRAEQSGASSSGLTLSEIKAAAAQAGFDAAIIERAARMLDSKENESTLERLLGGPLRHKQEVRLPITLDKEKAALLLSAVRISGGVAGAKDVGHSSALGMTWHDGSEMEAIGVTARPEKDGTILSIAIDRRGTLVLTALGSGVVMFLALLFSGSALYPESQALGIAGAIASVGGVLAIARGLWSSSTKRIRERMNVIMDAVNHTVSQGDAEPPRKLEPPSD